MGWNEIWVAMTPAVDALAVAAPIGTPIVAGIAAVAAIRTLRLRIRVDHADQWWKRVEFAVKNSLNEDTAARDVGTRMFEELLGVPPLEEGLSLKKKWERHQARKSRWKVSKSEVEMLRNMNQDIITAQISLQPDPLRDRSLLERMRVRLNSNRREEGTGE